jgi:hypothetical protein
MGWRTLLSANEGKQVCQGCFFGEHGNKTLTIVEFFAAVHVDSESIKKADTIRNKKK